MSEPTLQEWKEWADKIIAGKWHTTMLNAFCEQAVKDRTKLDDLEAKWKCADCYNVNDGFEEQCKGCGGLRKSSWSAERITELEAIAEKCGYPQEDGVEWYPLRRVRELEAENEELHQNICDECHPDDYGWNYNAVEGRVPCVCITESGAYQKLKARLKAVEQERDEWKQALVKERISADVRAVIIGDGDE